MRSNFPTTNCKSLNRLEKLKSGNFTSFFLIFFTRKNFFFWTFKNVSTVKKYQALAMISWVFGNLNCSPKIGDFSSFCLTIQAFLNGQFLKCCHFLIVCLFVVVVVFCIESAHTQFQLSTEQSTRLTLSWQFSTLPLTNSNSIFLCSSNI